MMERFAVAQMFTTGFMKSFFKNELPAKWTTDNFSENFENFSYC